MANSASLQLFELVSSMSRSEKRYFKIHIRTHSSKHEDDYVDVFQLVEKQEHYDEKALIEIVENKGSGQRFAVLKHRLFEKILDSLESYQRSRDDAMRLRHELNRAQVLLKRGMYRSGMTMLLKTEQQAMSIEAHETVLEVRALLAEYSEHLEGFSDEQAPTVHSILEEIATEHRLRVIREDLQIELRANGRSSNQQVKLTRLETALREIKEQMSLKPSSAYLAAHAKAILNFAKNNMQGSLEQMHVCHSLLTNHTYISHSVPLALADVLANMTYCRMMLHRPKEALSSLRELLEYNQEQMKAHHRIEYEGTLMQSLLFYLNRSDEIEMETILLDCISVFKSSRWSHAPLVRSGIDYGLGLYFHSRGDTGKALRALNRVLNDGEVKRDEDIYHRTLVLITLLHAESRDRSWMVHSARSLKRYLAPRDLLHGADALLLHYIADFRRSRSEEGEYRALETFADGLRVIRRSTEDRVAFEHFDFLAWAEQQIQALDETNKVA